MVEPGPQKDVARAKKTLYRRLALAIVVTLVSLWSVEAFRARIAYFFSGSEPIDLGDVRSQRASGKEPLSAPPWSYVRVRNLLVTRDSLGSKTYRYFYCPVSNLVVRTQRPLPEGSMRVSQAEIPAGLEYLVEQRKVFPEDFTRSFDAEGWLVPIEEVPGFKDPHFQTWLREELRLEGEELKKVMGLLDGERPGSQIWPIVVLVSSVVIFLMAWVGFAFSMRSWRKALRLSQEGA